MSAVGGVAPPISGPGLVLDQLLGHWIERLTATRMRTSPLVGGLDRETFDATQLGALDLAIVVHILTRERVDSDLLDAAFFHAWTAESEKWVNWMAQYVIQSDDDERPKLASALPLMRAVEGTPAFLAQRPHPVLFIQLARHLLRASIGDDDEVALSAATLTEHLDAFAETEPEVRNSTVAIVLMKTLFDVHAQGRIPGWFALLRRFDALVRDDHGFARQMIKALKGDDFDALIGNGDIVRNGAKIKAVQTNARLVVDLAKDHSSAARFFAEWPDNNYVALINVLKERGSHLGGDSGMRFLRAIGKPAFITTKDVVAALIRENVIARAPSSKRDFAVIQDAFNQWSAASGRNLTEISRILAMSIDA